MQPPGSFFEKWKLGSRAIGESGTAVRAAGLDNLHGRKSVDLHSIQGDGIHTRENNRGTIWRPPHVLSWGMHGAGAAEDGGKIPNRPGGQGLHSLAQSGRYGIKFDRRLARDSLRPLVEPGRGESSDRPGVSYRPEEERDGAPDDHQKHVRGENRRDDSTQEAPGRYDGSHRRKLDWKIEQQRTTGNFRVTSV